MTTPPPAGPAPEQGPPRRRARPRASVARLLRSAADTDPLVEQAPGLTLREVVRRFWPRLRPLRGWLLLGALLLAAAPAIAVVEVLLFGVLVDEVLVPVDWTPLPWLAAAYLGLNLLSGVVSGADDYLSTWISQRFLVGLRREAFTQVLAQPSASHDRRRLGDTISRLTSDIGAVERFMVGSLTTAVGASLHLAFYVGALLVLQWQLALASLVVVPLFWHAARRFASYTREVSRERRRRAGSITAVTEESLGTLPLVQAHRREEQALAAYHRQNLGIADAELAGSRVRAVFLPLVDLAELAGTLAVIGLGVWALETERLTLGGLLAFLTLLVQCYRPVRHLTDLVPELYSATAGVERVVELLDEPATVDPPGARPLPPGPGALELLDVHVTYPGATGPALAGLDLRVAAGERVALVGPSGAGKSTVLRLLGRHVEPERGRVLIDGHDVAEHTTASVRAAVTPVLQEQLLLDASVHDNIAYARPDATREEVEAAARAADAHEFVLRLPQGYDTRLGQRARTLSGGQRQRLALARALLCESRVLVLDEPTTGLDPAAAERLCRSVVRATCGRTLVVLTHDPVVLEHVDRVVRLEAPSADRRSAPDRGDAVVAR